MNTVTQLLNQDLIQIDKTNDFSQVENKLKNNNPTVFYVANKKDIIENNHYLKFVRIVRAIDFIDVQPTEGKKRFTDINESIEFIKNGLKEIQLLLRFFFQIIKRIGLRPISAFCLPKANDLYFVITNYSHELSREPMLEIELKLL